MGRGKNEARTRKLSNDELRVLWKEDSTFGQICRMLVLTAQRRSLVPKHL
jgi:hypothetical protein